MNYLITSLNSFKLSQFKCSEFIIKLDGILSRGNYLQVFTKHKYEELKELCKSNPHEKFESAPGDKETYVKQLRTFLFHYNQ